MRHSRGEVVVVRHKHHPVAGLAQPLDGAGQGTAGLAILTDGRLVQHDPRMCAREWPQPTDALTRRDWQLIEVLVDGADAKLPGEGLRSGLRSAPRLRGALTAQRV